MLQKEEEESKRFSHKIKTRIFLWEKEGGGEEGERMKAFQKM